jgi:hypothetical protein
MNQETKRRVADTISKKLAKELLKSIPVIGALFKVYCLVVDIMSEIKAEIPADSEEPSLCFC